MLLTQLLIFVAVLPALYAFLFGSGLRIHTPTHTARKCTSAPSQFDANFSPRSGSSRPHRFQANRRSYPPRSVDTSAAPQTPGTAGRRSFQQPSAPATNQVIQVNQAPFNKPTTPFKKPKWSRPARPATSATSAFPAVVSVPRTEEITRLAASYNGGLQGGQWHGEGTVMFVDGSIYEGSFEHGRKHGAGKETSATGLVVEGVFQHNQVYNATGTHVALDGTVTEGTWVNGKLEGAASVHYAALDKGVQAHFEQGRIVNGTGTFRAPDGILFEGQWQDGKFVGQGKVVFKDITFEGTFVNGTLQGEGSELHTNGVRFEGYFDNWKRVNGTIYFRHGNVYKGEFLHSDFHGRGQLNYSCGDVYEGGFENGLRHGYGVMRYANGGVYCGNWVNGDCNGNATYEKAKYRYEGEYVNNTRQGNAVIRFSNGGVYEGWVHEKQHGTGKHTSAYGEVWHGRWQNGYKIEGSGTYRDGRNISYSGEWVGGYIEGNATVKYPNGAVFVGVYARGKANGIGTMVYGDGSVYTGMWAGGVRHGSGVMKHSSGVVEEGRFVVDHYLPDEVVPVAGSDVVNKVEVVDVGNAINMIVDGAVSEAVNEVVDEAVDEVVSDIVNEIVNESVVEGSGIELIQDLMGEEVVITL